MKLAIKQFRVLMWKCYIIRKRHYLTTLFEFLFSLVANIIMVCVVNSINQKIHTTTAPSTDHRPLSDHPWTNETIWPEPQYRLSDHLWKFIFARPKILYSPQNSVTKRFMDELEFVLRERVVSLKTRAEYYGFDNEEELLNEYAKLNNDTDMSKGVIGIVFPQQPTGPAPGEQGDPPNAANIFSEEMNSFLNQFSYKIRTTSYSISGFYPEKESAGPYKSNLYLQDDYIIKNFIETQIFVNEAYLSLLLKRNNISLMSETEKENYARKKQDRQKLIDASLEMLDWYNKTHDDPNSQSMPDSNNDLNGGQRSGGGCPENAQKRIISQLDSLLIDNPFLREGNEHPEFLRNLSKLLAVEHPLFIQEIQAMRMPYPKYIERPPTSLIDLVPYVITNGFIILVPVIVKRMCDEKVNRIRESFRLMGLKDSIYFLSIFTNYFITILPQVIIITSLYTSSFFGLSNPVYDYTNPLLVGLILLLYGVHLILMSMFISIFIQRPVIGVVVSVVLFLISGLPHYFLDIRFNKGLNPNSPNIGQLISCVLPNMSINFIFRLISMKELYNYGAEFGNMFEYTHSYGIMSIGSILIVQVASCAMTCVLIWYLDAIWPDEFGLAKNWLFPYRWMTNLCFGKKPEEDLDDFYEALNSKTIKRSKSGDPELRSKYFEDEESFDADRVAILIRNLRKVYKASSNNEKVALDCVNLKLMKGQLTALLGHNGAGKTTLMSIITGFLNWNEGDVFINGFNIKTKTKLARKSISLCPQHNVLYNELSPSEHLHLYSVIKGEPSFRIEYDIGLMLDKLQLTKKANVPSQHLSGGMKRKLNLAIALIGSSKIVILDEPTSGMDTEARRQVWNLLLEARRSKTILLSTHYLEEADVTADRIVIISKGTVHCYGTPVFLKNSFGTGYQLRVQKSVDFTLKNRENLDGFIRRHFKNSKRYSESQGEIIYLLNGSTDTNCSEMVQDGQFASFFNEFEKLKSLQSYNINHFGISVTTLEDVFLRVTASDEFIFDVQYNSVRKKKPPHSNIFSRKANSFHCENAMKEDVTLTSYRERNLPDFSDMMDVDLSSCNDSTVEFIDSGAEEIRSCFLLCLHRFKGLLIKRYHYLRQSWIMFSIQLLIPLLVFAIILYVDRFLRSRLHFDQPFNLDYHTMYRHSSAFAYFQHNNHHTIVEEYDERAKAHEILTHEIDLKTNMSETILEKVKEIGMSGYLKDLLISATELPVEITYENGPIELVLNGQNVSITRKSFDCWFNNEVLHSLPISINLLYESVLSYLNLYSSAGDDDAEPERLRISAINHPFPNQMHYMYHFTSIQQFKIMWSLICSLTLPFLAAYYSVFPTHEHLTRSKLLQIMTGLSHKLYWIATFSVDITVHLVECGLIIALFYSIDGVGVFIDFPQTMLALFILLLLYGVCSILMGYIYSHLAPEVSTGYVLLVIFNLIFGLILSLCDYIIFYMSEFETISKSTYEAIKWVFRLFPLYGMTQGIVHLYVTGSKSHVCENLNEDILRITCKSNHTESIIFGCCKEQCGEDCYEYQHPFNWTPEGILNELIMMCFCAVLSLIVLVMLELNFSFRNQFRLWFSRGKPAFKKASFFIEDLDVSLERNRVENLVSTDHPHLINKNDALVVHQINKRYPNGHLAVNNLSFSVHNQECFGFLGINGAGKTSTFRMLVGDLECSSGNAYINGHGLRKHLKQFQQQIGYVPQFDALLGQLTGEQLLYLFGRLRGIPERHLKQKVTQIVQMTDLTTHYKRLSSGYSGGTKRKLSLAIALIGSPKIVFLDEPTSGVDVSARRKIWKTLVYLRKVHNCSLVLTSHSMEECEALCSRLAIMVNGNFKCLGSIQQLRKKYGQGFSLTIKMNQRYANNTNNSEYIRKLKERITKTFNQCLLKDIHQTVISYQILDATLSWSFLFTKMDAIKQEFKLEYYLIGDTSLEQIFINFSRQE